MDIKVFYREVDGIYANEDWEAAAAAAGHEDWNAHEGCEALRRCLYHQQELGLEGLPLIAENGAVIQPDVRWEMGQRHIRGMSHQDIHRLIEQIRLQLRVKFTTFDDVDEHVISEWTGLTRYRSALARKHEASVTLIWRDTDEKLVQFEEELANVGLKCLQGARFWHVLDARCGKDVAVNWLIEQYRELEEIEPTTLGLGDGPNDAPLLDSVDFAVVIKGINRQGITVLLIEQNANMALKIADIGYVLETGKITMTGTGQELLHDDNVRKAYLGG